MEGSTVSKGVFPSGHVINSRLNTYEEVEALATEWKLRTTQLERGSYRTLLQGIHTPCMQLGRSWRERSSLIEGEIPGETTMLAFCALPGSHTIFRGRKLELQDVILQQDSSLLDFSFSGSVDMITLAVSTEELQRRAHHLWHRPFPEHTGTLVFASPHAAQQAKRFCMETITGNLGNTPPAIPEFAKTLENQVLDGILSSLADGAPAVGTLGRHAAARRAAAILRDRCKEEISISDLCKETGATRRTLHLGFLELYGLSPMAYLKTLRLCRVRRDLARISDSGERITEVAMRWGFTHLGRFASSYRDFFGELPSAQKARANSNPVRCRLFR